MSTLSQYAIVHYLDRELAKRFYYAPSPRTITTIYSKFTDKPDIVEERLIKGNRTEINQWDSKFQRNRDLPDNIAYYDMGIESRKNEHLDAVDYSRQITVSGLKRIIKSKSNTMHDRIARELCTVYHQGLYFIHQKTESDQKPPLQLRPEWIEEKLECNYIDAVTMAESWKRLGMSKQAVNKMIFGYYDEQNGEYKRGLQLIGPSQGEEYALYFETLANQLEEFDEIEEIRKHYYDVSQRMIESGDWKAKYYEQSPDAWDHMKWIEYQTMVELDTDLKIWEPETDEDEGFVSHFGDEEPEPSLDVFGINRIYHGDEGIDQELITEIKESNPKKLKAIQQRFYPRQTPWRTLKPIYNWMNNQQKEKAWKFINARKAQLAGTKLGSESIEMLKMLDEIDTSGMRRAMVASFCAGNRFNLYGDIIKWEFKPTAEETYAIWAKYREYEEAI